MKTIIIPDIHNRIAIADTILARHPNDNVVFLGDYFDDFHDNKHIVTEVAHWLKPKLNNQLYTWLFGNHDLPYAYPQVNGLQCSGFTWDKCAAINDVLDENDWKMMQFSHTVDDWTITHAGCSNKLKLVSDDVIRVSLERGDLHPLLNAGRGRGGWARCGGITWCDYDQEFQPNELYPKQVFGHTPHNDPRCRKFGMVGENWCIDTHSRHYAIIEDERLTIHDV